MPEFTNEWFDHNIAHLEQLLSPLRDKPDVRMLEIGAYEGRSTLWFLDHILTGPRSRLISVDTWSGSAELFGENMFGVRHRFRANLAEHLASQRLIAVEEESQAFLCRRLARYPTHLFDIIYVDGSHAAPDVLSDAVLSFRLLEPGGLLIFDDYEWVVLESPEEQPKVAIDAFLTCFQGLYDEVYRGYQLAIAKR